MKTITTAVAVFLATIFMTACGNRESAAPAEAAPQKRRRRKSPAATSEAPANTEDEPATSGDKVAPN